MNTHFSFGMYCILEWQQLLGFDGNDKRNDHIAVVTQSILSAEVRNAKSMSHVIRNTRKSRVKHLDDTPNCQLQLFRLLVTFIEDPHERSRIYPPTPTAFRHPSESMNNSQKFSVVNCGSACIGSGIGCCCCCILLGASLK